jgi:hypothetical protein
VEEKKELSNQKHQGEMSQSTDENQGSFSRMEPRDPSLDALVNHVKSKSIDTAAGRDSQRLSEINVNSTGGVSNYSDYNKSNDGVGCKRCWFGLFEYRNVEDYFKVLILTLTINILCFMIGFLQAFLVRPPKGQKWSNQNTLAVVCLISGCLAMLNVITVIVLLLRPQATLGGISFILISSQLLLYVCEVSIYYQPDPNFLDDDDSASSVIVSSVCTIVLFCWQAIVGLAMYKYWQFLTYNYDGSTTISIRSSLLGGHFNPELSDSGQGGAIFWPDHQVTLQTSQDTYKV